MAITQTAAQDNMNIIRAWIDAHNRQDMKALDYMDEQIEILEIPTGVVYKGMAKMKELAEMAYRRRVWKEITHMMATDDQGVTVREKGAHLICNVFLAPNWTVQNVQLADVTGSLQKSHALHIARISS